jgi:hypothetical protein
MRRRAGVEVVRFASEAERGAGRAAPGRPGWGACWSLRSRLAPPSTSTTITTDNEDFGGPFVGREAVTAGGACMVISVRI